MISTMYFAKDIAMHDPLHEANYFTDKINRGMQSTVDVQSQF